MSCLAIVVHFLAYRAWGTGRQGKGIVHERKEKQGLGGGGGMLTWLQESDQNQCPQQLKVISRLLWFSFTTLRDWLPKFAPVSQLTRNKIKTFVPRFHAFCRAWHRLHEFALSSDWSFVLFVIGRSNYFGFGFTTLNCKLLFGANNRTFSLWRHFTTTTRICQFLFSHTN